MPPGGEPMKTRFKKEIPVVPVDAQNGGRRGSDNHYLLLSVSFGDGGNPSPLGEEKVIVCRYATLSAGREGILPSVPVTSPMK